MPAALWKMPSDVIIRNRLMGYCVAIELRGLDDDDKSDRVLMFAHIPLQVELGHQSEEYSSANEPRHTFPVPTKIPHARRASERCEHQVIE